MLKILYIDDEATSRSLFQTSFKDDYEIYLADSAKKGEEILSKQEIPVIISDQHMPKTSGTQCTSFLKASVPERSGTAAHPEGRPLRRPSTISGAGELRPPDSLTNARFPGRLPFAQNEPRRCA